MKFRKRYAIPAVGLALSGCMGSGVDDGDTDPIVGDWNITKAKGDEMPSTYTLYWDTTDPVDSGTCSREYTDSPLSISETLAAQFILDSAETCVSAYTDWESYDSKSTTYTGTVTVVETKVSYQIELTGESALSLDCSMEDETVLNCKDGVDRDWYLEKQAD